MTFDKWIWVAVVTVMLGAFGTYRWTEHKDAEDQELATKAAVSKSTTNDIDHYPSQSSKLARLAESYGSDENKAPTKQLTDSQKQAAEVQAKLADATRIAFREAVIKARQQQAGDSADAPSAEAANSQPPAVEMSFEQYRVWAKMSGALAKRDYRKVESMIDDMNGVLEQQMIDAILDTAVQDYADYLSKIRQDRCDGYNAESVWRKTVFMSFALARMNRASAELENQAQYARQLCGYAS